MKKSDETEEKIVQATLELFVRKGYHGTSINDIMVKVGLTKGAFYAHFSKKGDLLFRLIEAYKTEYLDIMMRTAREFPGNALEKIHRIISFNARYGAENPELPIFLAYLTTELKADVDFEPALRSGYREYQQFISELIRQGIHQGLFKKDIDPDLAALIFIATHDGILHQWMLNRYHIDGQLYIRTFRKIFLNGLTK